MKDRFTEKLNMFKSVREFLKVFSTEKKCENFLKKIRWGDKVISPYDETATKNDKSYRKWC